MPKDDVVIKPKINMPPATTAAMKEDLAAHRTEMATGETDLPFEGWLKATRPHRWEIYLKTINKSDSD